MTEQKVQTNPFHAALVASQEAYIGELLGKYLEVDAKLRLAQNIIKDNNEKLALHEQQAEQLKEAQETLRAAVSNKDAFEEQNTTLIHDVNALKRELQDVKKERQQLLEANLKIDERHQAEVAKLKHERQLAEERELKAKEALQASKPKRQRKPKGGAEAVDGKHDTA